MRVLLVAATSRTMRRMSTAPSGAWLGSRSTGAPGRPQQQCNVELWQAAYIAMSRYCCQFDVGRTAGVKKMRLQ
jgi:hypothetical protein